MLAGIVLLLVVLAFLLGFLLGGRSMKHRMEAEHDSVVQTVRETTAGAVSETPEGPSESVKPAETAKAAESTAAETTKAADAAKSTSAAETTKAAERSTQASSTTQASSSAQASSSVQNTVEPRALTREGEDAAEAEAAEASAPRSQEERTISTLPAQEALTTGIRDRK